MKEKAKPYVIWFGWFIVRLVIIAIFFKGLLFLESVFKPADTQPEIIRSYKVGDEPSIHRVWSVTVDGETIKYVEIVNDWR